MKRTILATLLITAIATNEYYTLSQRDDLTEFGAITLPAIIALGGLLTIHLTIRLIKQLSNYYKETN